MSSTLQPDISSENACQPEPPTLGTTLGSDISSENACQPESPTLGTPLSSDISENACQPELPTLGTTLSSDISSENVCQPEPPTLGSASSSDIPSDQNLSDEDFDLIAGMHPELDETPESESDWHLDPNALPQRVYAGMKFQVLLLALMAASGRWSDSQVQMVLTFISQFLVWLVNCEVLTTMVTDFFPGTVYRLRKMIGLSSDKLFTRKAVCNRPDCCALYDLGDIYSLDWMLRKTPKTCSALIDKHGTKVKCGNALAKTVFSSTGKRFIMPLKTFCQRSITAQIKHMLSRPDVEPLLGKWRTHNTPENIRKDVYSGKVWKRMQNKWGFFKSDYEFGLTLNIDWFRPHKSSNKSLGAMYMTVLNLPR